MDTLKISSIVSKYKLAENDDERLFFLNMLESEFYKKIEKTKKIKKELKMRSEYRKFKDKNKR